MKIRAIAIDQDKTSLKQLEMSCAAVGFIELSHTFCSTASAFRFLSEQNVDLLFLNLQTTGFALYERLKYHPMVIYTTTCKDAAAEAFAHNALDYLLKPYTEARFRKALDKAKLFYRIHYMPAPSGAYLFLSVNYGKIRIRISDIIYAKGLDNYMKLYLQDGTVVIVRMTRTTLLSQLPETDFVQLHRSYIVALAGIQEIRRNSIIIKGVELPIGRTFKAQFLYRYNQSNYAARRDG